MLDILLAEDERDVREALTEALESVGHRVSCAKDGEEAQAMIADREKSSGLVSRSNASTYTVGRSVPASAPRPYCAPPD